MSNRILFSTHGIAFHIACERLPVPNLTYLQRNQFKNLLGYKAKLISVQILNKLVYLFASTKDQESKKGKKCMLQSCSSYISANRKMCYTHDEIFYIDLLLAYTVSFKKALNSVIF